MLRAFKFVLGSHATDYQSFIEAEEPLKLVTDYLLRGHRDIE